ncbi:MAG: hypothetical protein HQK56_14920 [Deltaproteobacteria bacterium]|nr:hypothetical protein [Deltaproteobacteria bacterium]
MKIFRHVGGKYFIFISVASWLCLFIALPCSAGVTVFNDKVLGIDIQASFSLMSTIEQQGVDIRPSRVELFINDSKFTAATVYYVSIENNFEILEEALSKLYPGSKIKKMPLDGLIGWRVDERKFAVTLWEDGESCKEGKEKQIMVIYKLWKYWPGL